MFESALFSSFAPAAYCRRLLAFWRFWIGSFYCVALTQKFEMHLTSSKVLKNYE